MLRIGVASEVPCRRVPSWGHPLGGYPSGGLPRFAPSWRVRFDPDSPLHLLIIYEEVVRENSWGGAQSAHLRSLTPDIFLISDRLCFVYFARRRVAAEARVQCPSQVGVLQAVHGSHGNGTLLEDTL